MKLWLLTVLSAGSFMICLPSCNEQPLPRRVADAYGFRHFGRIRSIAYTFNVKSGSLRIARSWKWYPATEEVYFMNSTDTIRYRRDTVTTGSMKLLDRKFLNDRRWLLFPFQLIWNKKDTFSVSYGRTMPISGDTGACLTVAYKPAKGGDPRYTYDLYLDKRHHIREWACRQATDPVPVYITTWEHIRSFKGIKIATMHYSKDSAFQVWFSDISVN